MKRLLILTLSLALAPLSHAFEFLHYLGSGRSMEPVLQNGEILAVLPLEFRYIRAGRIAAFTVRELNGGETVAHRLVRLTESGWITRGDGNTQDDPWRVTQANYLGLVEKQEGRVNLTHARILTFSLRHVYVLNAHATPDSRNAELPALIPSGWTGGGSPTVPTHSVPDDGGGTLALMICALLTIAAALKLSSAPNRGQ